MARVSLTYGILGKIANSDEIQQSCLRIAQSAAAQASATSHISYITNVRKGKFRAHARASTPPTKGAFFTEWRTQALRRAHPKI